MTIQQIIDEQIKELYRSVSIYGTINNHIPRETKDTIRSITHKLIEAVGEELINEGERIYDNGAYGDEACESDECHFESGYLVARDVVEGQQIKLKEIINSLK